MMRDGFARGVPLGVAALAVYAALAPTTIVDGDNAEFASLAALGGRAHPPGYPLYVLWLRATSWLPAASAAHAAALATCVLAALAVVVLHAACRAWGARPGAADAAAAIVAASPLVLQVHTEAEVFALNGLAAACVLWLAAAGGPLRGVARVAALGLVAGLGLANHPTCVLLAPVGLAGAVRGVREAPRWARAVAAGVGALALGLAPYVYLAVAPDTAASWGQSTSAGALVDHVLRRDYGGASAFAVSGELDPLAQLAALATALARGLVWAPLAVAVVAIAARVRRGDDRVGWAALAVSWLATCALVARFDLPVVGLGRHLVERFYLLPLVIATVPVAAGMELVAARLGARTVAAVAGWRAPALAIAAFVALAAASAGRVRALHAATLEHGLADVLDAMPRDAVLVVGADDLAFGTTYLQDVRGVRPDVTVVEWPMMTLPWYRERVAARGAVVPASDAGDPGDVASVRMARALLASGRPVLVGSFDMPIARALPSYPYAGVVRVLPPGAAISLDAVVAENRAALARFDLSDPRPGPDDGYATVARLRFAETWSRLATALDAAGHPDAAAAARATAEQLGPDDDDD
jgi:hypothetical protein|nr:DUF2723 domain-containing protein [Kofleriaceae bacterium]